MRTRIKICGITRPDDGLAAAHAGADAIGFVFWAGTPRVIAPPAARAIRALLPPFVSVVGLFVDPTPDEVRAVLAALPLDLLQFHGHEPAELCRSFGRPYLKAIPVSGAATGAGLLEYAARYGDAAGVLFDAPPAGGLPGGTGQSFDWDALPRGLPQPLVLSGGLHAGNVAAAVCRVRPWAVDVSSGVEVRDASGALVKGRKDPARIKAFIEEVRNADGGAP
ncbi:MAG: phosphoribosylanthranilate isomerase [Betaproteobacteria bacterium]|nr:phosphoribosylanthranilate isomerase [Betaproteobacteria bacterium]MBK7081456.1 phosphoribosylanthranilate isomerase [Betaproteobacteria bacterium]